MIQCVSLPIPDTEVQVKIDDVSLKQQIKSEKLKYLGLCKMVNFNYTVEFILYIITLIYCLKFFGGIAVSRFDNYFGINS